MVFSFNIITLKNTIEANAKITNLSLSKGVFVKWFVYFPSGSQGLLHLRIMRGNQTILPTNFNGSIVGNNVSMQSEEFIFFSQPPYQFEIHTWNFDETYDHRLFGHIVILPLWKFNPFSESFIDMTEKLDKD